MRITWHGHSCFSFEGTKKVLIDPFFPKGFTGSSPDIVALTHGHSDHIGETLRLNRMTIAINETAKILASRGLRVEGLNIGGTITIDGVRFTMTPAIHSGGLELEGSFHYGGGACGYIIEIDRVRVYHSGDTALFSDMKLIGELNRPDIALLPIGGRYTMGPNEALIAANYIGAPLIIPMHYSTWPAIEQDPTSFKFAIERTTDMKVQILQPGSSFEIDKERLRETG